MVSLLRRSTFSFTVRLLVIRTGCATFLPRENDSRDEVKLSFNVVFSVKVRRVHDQSLAADSTFDTKCCSSATLETTIKKKKKDFKKTLCPFDVATK